MGKLLRADDQIRDAEARLRELRSAREDLQRQAMEASKPPAQLRMESTAELEASIAQVDEINAKVRANLERGKAKEDAAQYTDQYNALTDQIEDVRARKAALLEGAQLPLPGLSVADGVLTYNGHPWDCMSGSEQLRVATAIVRKLNPNCGFVLMDKLEQLDRETLADFGAWLEAEGLQVIATRVSTDSGECSLIIEDGEALYPEPKTTSWKAGEF